MGFAVGGRRRVARLDQRGAVGDRRVVVIGRVASRLVERRPDLLAARASRRRGSRRHGLRQNGRVGVEALTRAQAEGRTQQPVGDHLRVFVVTQEEAPALVVQAP